MKKYISVLLCVAMMFGCAYFIGTPEQAKAKTVGTTLYADKVTTAPDIDDPTTWGTPALTFDKDSANATIHNHNATAEDTTVSIYLAWDETYLYFGMSSPDSNPKGSKNGSEWEGDGMQIRIEKDELTTSRQDIYVTLTESLTSSHGSSEGYTKKTYLRDGVLYTMVAFPHASFGFEPEDIVPSATYAFNVLRISGTSTHVYAGWLALGQFFSAGHDYNKNATGDCEIVLRDPDQPGAEIRTDDDTEKKFTDITDNSGLKSYNDLIKNYNVPAVQTADGSIYLVYTTKIGIMHAKGTAGYNAFSLQKVDENGNGTEVGYAYTQGGSQDIFADANGVVYVVGGGSSWDIKKLSSYYDYKSSKEKAYLNVWVYENGFLNGISTQKAFTNPSVDGYDYVCSTMENNQIKYVFMGKTTDGKYAVEYFTFDIATKKFVESNKPAKIQDTPVLDDTTPEELSAEFTYGGKKYTVKMSTTSKATASIYCDGVLVKTEKLDNKVIPNKNLFACADKDGKVILVFAGAKKTDISWYWAKVSLN